MDFPYEFHKSHCGKSAQIPIAWKKKTTKKTIHNKKYKDNIAQMLNSGTWSKVAWAFGP